MQVMDCVERIESLTVEDFISVSVCLHYFNFIFVYVLILFINKMMDVTLSSKDLKLMLSSFGAPLRIEDY